MTGFEHFLETKGYKLIHGRLGDFSTYGNVCRHWINENKDTACLVGLWAEPTRIGITFPWVYLNGEAFTTNPEEMQYAELLNQIETKPL